MPPFIHLNNIWSINGGIHNKLTQMYWLIKLLIDIVPSAIKTEIGTHTNIDMHMLVNVHFMVESSGALVNNIGSKAINEMNHPAPNGNGKYLVQNELGTTLENKN